jgi:ABC-type multidrug transport system ATPase subunit
MPYNSGLNSPLLTAHAIAKRFGPQSVLQDVSFSVQQHEILGLIGPNGSGKTTLFECLAGLIPTDSGDVTFRGRALAPAHRKQALFYLPDAIRPWADQTVAWVLTFFEALHAAPKHESTALAKALALDAVLKSRVSSLSKGELKRFLLALGLLTPHPLLLLDEPFDGLDFRQARDVMALLRTYPAKGRTLFLSIHQLTDAARVCDRLLLLNNGRVACQGTLPELQAQAGLPDGGLEEIFLALT